MIDAYLGGIDLLRQAVAGMTPEELVARPVDGRWSTLEVVCHLADFEPIYADRMKRVIATDRPLLLSAGRESFARTLAYHGRDIGEELDLIDVTRRQMARILRSLPKDAWDRVGVYRHEGHEELRSLSRLLEVITGHIPHHAAFIAEKRRALGIESGRVSSGGESGRATGGPIPSKGVAAEESKIGQADGRGCHLDLADTLGRLPTSEGQPFVVAFEHGTLSVEMFAPRGVDTQAAHRRDEVYVVARGEGYFVNGPDRHRFGPGDLLFVPAGVGHRFEEFTDDLAVWVIFYGPDGGEREGMGRSS